MHRGGRFPYFLFQEYKENWETLPSVKVTALNKAAAKGHKTVTLSCLDPREKSTMLFEKMILKNDKGSETPIRCLILNNKSLYAIWTFNKNDDANFTSFPPHMTYFLELLFQKKVPKVDFYYKAEIEVDFSHLVMRDKNNDILYRIQREAIDFVPTSWNRVELRKYCRDISVSINLMERVCIYDVARIKNLLFNIPITATEVSNSTSLLLSSHNWISVLKEVTSKDNTLMTVDPLCDVNNLFNVTSEDGYFFSATLVLTKLEENVNKFYILQLLKLKSKKKYVVYTRSGRIGYIGHLEFSENFSSLKDAKYEFEDRFYEKTQNLWSERHSFQRKANKYDYIDTYFNAGTTDDCLIPSLENVILTLDKKFKELLLLITEVGDLKLVLKKWLLKSLKTKIGLPTANQIIKAFVALNEVSDILCQENKGKDLVVACNNYYMKIPHGTKFSSPKMILCAEMVEKEILMLQTLAYETLNFTERTVLIENPVKAYFQKTGLNLSCIDHGSPEFTVLQQSLLGLHGPTHTYKIELLDAFKWHSEREEKRFVSNGNNMLLWHGTHISNFLGIIENGLTLPPVDAHATSMFGRALYFADVSSKSANYCLPSKKNAIGLLMLCEVSMGKPLEVIHGGDYSSHPSYFGGIHALGEFYPSHFTECILVPGAVIPQGPLIRRRNEDIVLKYNEYAIYDEKQVKIRYLLKIKFF